MNPDAPSWHMKKMVPAKVPILAQPHYGFRPRNRAPNASRHTLWVPPGFRGGSGYWDTNQNLAHCYSQNSWCIFTLDIKTEDNFKMTDQCLFFLQHSVICALQTICYSLNKSLVLNQVLKLEYYTQSWSTVFLQWEMFMYGTCCPL